MTEGAGNSPFAAVDATLGYLYQVRSALLWALRRLKDDQNFLVSIETLDDVTFETTGGEAIDLLQTKHHHSASANLTDASPDLWKTLRIWFEGHASGQIPSTANLTLVTTALASTGTAASYLRAAPDFRDISAAQHALDSTASSSSNKANASAYEAYLRASLPERVAVLERIVIIDAAPAITDLDAELRTEVYWAVARDHHTAFLERLEGWWLRRVLRQLTDATRDRVGAVEIEAQMSDLREQFKQDSLPIDEDLLAFSLDEATKAAHGDSLFVKQLEIIKAGQRRISAAIRDYYRAFEQRSRWLRDDLVVGIDLHNYENRLVEEWDLMFAAMSDEIGDAAADDAKEKAARTLLAWAERASISIRPSVTEPFVSRGSLHMLSDDLRIGWHPEFKDLLAPLLTPENTE